MKKKLIIIGVNSFIGNNLYLLLKSKFQIKKISYKNFFSMSLNSLNKVSYVINCATNKRYVNYPYNEKNDFDIIIAKKIKNLKCKMIFLSTRKIYRPGDNLNEKSFIKPNCHYSKNKFTTEKTLSQILVNKILILRISNIIGLNTLSNTKRKIHNTFIDNFFYNAAKGKIFNNKKIYKDFITIKKFSQIIQKLVNQDIVGLFNVSCGRKIYLNEIVKYLNFYNKKECKLIDLPKNFNKQVFYFIFFSARNFLIK